MQVWVPTGNQIQINEVRASNLWDRNYWNAYFAEEDLEVRETMLAGYKSETFRIRDRLLSEEYDYN